MADKTLIRTLVEAWGPPGYEHETRAVIQQQVNALADEIRVDGAGNLICRMGSGPKKIMIAAHMDEIGLIVSHIDKDGYARFVMNGFLFPATLYGNRVRFANGVIGSIGMENGFDPSKTPKLTDFFIDVSESFDGSNGSNGGGKIQVGDVAAMYYPMIERGERLIAKSMDDRIGCAVAIETMRRLAEQKADLPHTLYFVFTTQEEVGVRGARAAAFGLNPDYGIALDVTLAGDTPRNRGTDIKLGAGTAIKVMDSGHIVPPAMKALMIRRAQEAKIPYQLEVLTGGSTDAMGIQITAAGIPSGVISIPCRYVHTTSETVDVNDVQASIDLLTAMLSQPMDGLG